MLRIRVEIKGDKKALRQIAKVIHEFDDWSDELEAVGNNMVEHYQDPVFETEGGIFGARWQELSSAYQIRKATRYPGRGILEATGALRKSYRKRVFANLLEIVNEDPKAVYHQSGTRKMPPRILMLVGKKERDKIWRIFRIGAIAKVEKAIKGA